MRSETDISRWNRAIMPITNETANRSAVFTVCTSSVQFFFQTTYGYLSL